MRSWVKIFLVVLVCGVPLVFNPSYVDGYNLPKITLFYLLVTVIFALWLIPQLSSGKIKIKVTALFYPALLWVVANIVATVFSISPFQSIWGQYQYYSYGLLPLIMACIFSFLVQQLETDRSIFNWVILGAVLSAIYGFMDLGQNSRINTTFGSPIYFSLYLAGITPIALSRCFEKRNRLVWLISLTVIASGLVVAASRGAWLAAGISILLFLLTSIIRKQLKPGQVYAALAGLALVTAYLIINPTSHNKLKTTFDRNESSNFSRYEGWKAGLAIIKQNPFFGVGPANFMLAFRQHKTLEYVRSVGTAEIAQGHAHNDVIQALTTTGLVGFGAYLYFWIMTFIQAIKNTKRGIFETGIFAGLCAIFVFNQFNNGMVPGLMLLWLLIGWIGRYDENQKVYEIKPQKNSVAVTSAVIFIVFAIYLMSIPFRAEVKFIDCNSAAVLGNYKQAFKDLGEAIEIHPSVKEYYKMMLDLGYEISSKTPDRSVRKAYLDTVQYYAEKNAEINRYDSDAHYNLGVVYVWKYELLGEDLRGKAENAFLESLKHDKYFTGGLTGLAKVSYLNGRPEQAKEYFKQVLEIEPNNGEALKRVK